jgi:flagellar basal-body rod modification protein FlgD
MSTSPIGSSSASNTTDTTSTDALSSLTPNDFLKMLIAELQNQDPTQPVSNTEILDEVSQIGNIETNQTLSNTLQGVALEQSLSTATNLLQKTVTAVDSSGNTISGTVDSISVANGTATFTINGTSVPFSDITSITPAAATSSATNATN